MNTPPPPPMKRVAPPPPMKRVVPPPPMKRKVISNNGGPLWVTVWDAITKEIIGSSKRTSMNNFTDMFILNSKKTPVKIAKRFVTYKIGDGETRMITYSDFPYSLPKGYEDEYYTSKL